MPQSCLPAVGTTEFHGDDEEMKQGAESDTPPQPAGGWPPALQTVLEAVARRAAEPRERGRRPVSYGRVRTEHQELREKKQAEKCARRGADGQG